MAVLTSFTINGTSVVDLVQVASLRIEKRLNARSVASFTIRDPDGNGASYRPSVRERVIIVVDGVTEFLGLVWTIEETHVVHTRGIQLTVRCVDYAALLDVVYFNGPIGSGLLRDVSTPLIINLAPHGIIQDPGTDAGPTVGDQAFPFVTITNGLNDLSLESGWVWRVSPQIGTNFPVIGFFEPGTIPAPQDFTTAIGRVERAAFARDLTRYTNNVWVRYGEGEHEVTQRFLGNGVLREWRLENALAQLPATIVVTRASGVSIETVDADYLSGSAMWHYDPANNWNQRVTHGTGTTLATGEYADFTYMASFPGAVLAIDEDEYLASGPYTIVQDLPNVYDRATALAYANAVLRRRGGIVRTGRVSTAVAGYAPYQTVTVDLPLLQVNTSAFLITEVVMSHRTVGPGGVHHFGYQVAMIEGNEFQENWLDYYLPERRDRGFGVVPPEGAGGVGGDSPPTTGPGPEYVTFGPTCYPIGATGVNVPTTTAAAWTNGPWIEIMPASAAPSVFWAFLGIEVVNIIDTCQVEFDVALGPSGSENANIIATFAGAGNVSGRGHFECPIAHGPISPGTRVSCRVRYQDLFGQQANNQNVKIVYFPSVPPGITLTTLALKCHPTAATGTSIAHSGASWTNGAWSQIHASIPTNWSIVGLCAGSGDLDGSFGVEFDIGTGTTPVTTIKVASPQAVSTVTQGFILDQPLSNGTSIPPVPIGSQVQVRKRQSNTTGSTRVKVLYYPGDI